MCRRQYASERSEWMSARLKRLEKMLFNQGSYEKNKFLSEVDLSKGKIKVKVNTMIRQLAPDWSTEREDRKEYLTFNSDWIAKNYLGVNIRVLGHIEGVFMDQQKELVTKKDPGLGRNLHIIRKATKRDLLYSLH